MSQAELMEYGRMKIIYAYTVFDSPISNVVGCSVDMSCSEPTTGK